MPSGSGGNITKSELDEMRQAEAYETRWDGISDQLLIQAWRTQTNPDTGKPLTTGDEWRGLVSQWHNRFDMFPPEPDGIVHHPAPEAELETPSKPVGDDVPILGQSDLAAYLGVSVSTVDRMRKDGRVPEPVRLTERKIGWTIAQAQALRAAGLCR